MLAQHLHKSIIQGLVWFAWRYMLLRVHNTRRVCAECIEFSRVAMCP